MGSKDSPEERRFQERQQFFADSPTHIKRNLSNRSENGASQTNQHEIDAMKQIGNKYFAAKNYSEAIVAYTQAIVILI